MEKPKKRKLEDYATSQENTVLGYNQAYSSWELYHEWFKKETARKLMEAINNNHWDEL